MISVVSMGRWTGKPIADGLLAINIFWLRKEHFLKGFRIGSITWTRGEKKSSVSITVDILTGNFIELAYSQTSYQNNSKQSYNYKVPITSTPCNYGGKRYWFICPMQSNGLYCGRRVATLYMLGNYFACRHCNDLTYQSRCENYTAKWRFFSALFEDEDKVDEFYYMKRKRYYKGKPTKAYQKILRLEDKSYRAAIAINKIKDL